MPDANMGSIHSDLDIDTKEFTTGMQNALNKTRKLANNFANNFNKSVKTSFDSAKKSSNEFKKNASNDFKDVTRIIQGILISQGFYRLIGVIKETTIEIFDMAKSFEVAKVSFSLLLSSMDKSSQLLSVLEDFAAVTPFAMESARTSAQQLLAMGFKAENLLPILTGIVDAASLRGGSTEIIAQITRALGQMNTAGYVAARQINQLAMAGIPVKEILSEELGLTLEQLQNIGNLKIPSDVGVAAVLAGMKKRYGGASELIAQTFTGLTSTIKDNFGLVMKDLTTNAFNQAKTLLRGVATEIDAFRQSMRTTGIGGAIDAAFSSKAAKSIRIFVANIKLLRAEFKQLTDDLKPAIDGFQSTFTSAITYSTLVLTRLIQALRILLSPLLNSINLMHALGIAAASLTILYTVSTAVHVFTTALKGLTIVVYITRAVQGLYKALIALKAVMLTSPVALLITLAAAALLYFAAQTEVAKNAMQSLRDAWSNWMSTDISNTLVPDTKEITDASDQFNQSLSEGVDGFENWGDAAASAADKAKKAVASFDEVFTLSDALDTSTDALDNYEVLPEIDPAFFDDLQASLVAGAGDLNFDILPEIDTSNWVSLEDILESWVSLIKDFFGEFKGFNLGGELVTWKEIGQTISDAYHYLKDLAKVEIPQYFDDIKLQWKQLKSWWPHKMYEIDELVRQGKNRWIAIFEVFFPETTAAIETKWTELKTSFDAGLEDIRIAIDIKINQWKEAISTKWDEIKIDTQIALTSLMSTIDDSLSPITTFFETTWEKLKTTVDTKGTELYNKFISKFEEIKTGAKNKFDEIKTSFSNLFTDLTSNLEADFTPFKNIFDEKWEEVKTKAEEIWGTIKDLIPKTFTTMSENVTTGFANFIKSWSNGFSDLFDEVNSWVTKVKNKIQEAIDKLTFWNKSASKASSANVNVSTNTGTYSVTTSTGNPYMGGHKAGGIFSKQHIAEFAEGGNPEAAIPTANMADTRKVVGAMLQAGFQDAMESAVSKISTTRSDDTRPLIVGTLIADDSSLRKLNRKMKVIQLEETRRRGGS